MSFSIALKFIYSFVWVRVCVRVCGWWRRGGGVGGGVAAISKNAPMPELIKSKLRESRHSSDCIPTHPCCASNGEKLLEIKKKQTQASLSLLFLFMCTQDTQLLVDGAVTQKRERGREKKHQLAKHVYVVQYSWEQRLS